MSLAFLLVGLSACGFQLRGANQQVLQDVGIYIQSLGANILAAEVRQQLTDAGTEPVTSAVDADYIITLSNESFHSKVLSVSPTTGKAEEYEITYTATLEIVDKSEGVTTSTESISAVRGFTFNQGAILGKIEEEAILKQDIAKQVAVSVLRRLRAAAQ